MTTLIDTRPCLRKLRTSIAGCSPYGVALPMWASNVRDVIDLIEQQEKQIAALRSELSNAPPYEKPSTPPRPEPNTTEITVR